MKPILHAEVSAKRFGGIADDYLAIHEFIDSSKMCVPDVRHRAMFHHSYGCYLVQKIFGHRMTNSSGKVVSPRDVAEQHIIDDLGYIPTLADWLHKIPLEAWMGNPTITKKTYSLEDLKNGTFD